MLSLGPTGTPYVAYVLHGGKVVVASRGARHWHSQVADRLGAGWQLRALEVGPAGPVALAGRADPRRIVVLRRTLLGWQAIRLPAHLPAQTLLGWPGLALGRNGEPLVAY